MKTIVIIQARTGSTRLPNKILKDLYGKIVLDHVIERVSISKEIDQIIIATTDKTTDDPIAEFCEKNNVSYFRGDEDDVLSRYHKAALAYYGDIIVRITSDCPLIDPNLIDSMLKFYKGNNFTFVTNAAVNHRTYPRGLDVEIFSKNELKRAYDGAIESSEREHVTPYIYKHCNNIYYYESELDYSYHRWTLDTIEDFELISEVYRGLYVGKHDFFMNEILDFINNNPQLMNINSHIEQKKV